MGLAAARGATPLVLVLQFGPEDAVEQALRRRILDAPGLPCLLVEIDPAWRVPGDVHPDARAARAIAAAVASRLRVVDDRHGDDGGSEKFTVAVMMTGVGTPFSSVGS